MTSIPPVRPAPGLARPAPTPASAPPAPPPLPNPSRRIEPMLGIVVVELRDAGGEVVRSVPTERALRAYRAALLRGDAPGASGEQAQPPGRQAEAGEHLDPALLLPRA